MAWSSSDIALVTASAEVTYAELTGLCDWLTASVPERALVFLRAANCLEAVAFYCACLRKGAVPLMMGKLPGSDAWELLDAEYRPEFAWVEAGSLPGREVVCSYGAYALVRLRDGSPGLHPDLALLLSTSGSTGSPKLVRLSRRNLRANAESICKYLGIEPQDRAITTLPFDYAYGISIVNSHLLAGASVVLTGEPLVSRGFWGLLRKKRANNFGGVPFTYQMLKRLRFGEMNVPSLRYITQAGGRLGEALHAEFVRVCAEKGIGFCAMYGQTEATARMSYVPMERAAEKVGSIGVAIPGGELWLEDGEGAIIERSGVEGELVYRGPNVSMGYATCASDLMLGDEFGGVLHTGDIAWRDEDGYYYVTGRKGRFCKVYGNRVGFDELEQVLLRAGIVAAVTGVDDHVTLFVEDGDPSAAMCVVAEGTGLNPWAFSAVKLDALPRSESGKVLYSALENV